MYAALLNEQKRLSVSVKRDQVSYRIQSIQRELYLSKTILPISQTKKAATSIQMTDHTPVTTSLTPNDCSIGRSIYNRK